MKKFIFLVLGILISSTILLSQTWSQIGDDIFGEGAHDLFGGSVSINSVGDIIAIGAKSNSGNGIDAGHVRIYQHIDGVWSQIGQDIDGEAEGDYFGSSVCLNSEGSIIAIGAPRYKHYTTYTYDGQVRIYQYIEGIWTQIGNDIYGEAAHDCFGNSVSLNSDGSIISIGADYNDGNGDYSGHVRIYQYIEGIWTQIGSDIDGEAANDLFGRSISLNSDGSTIAIGAKNNDGNGNNSGHVRIFQNIEGNWIQLGEDIDGEESGDEFGISVSINNNGSIVAVGASNNDGNGDYSGQVRIFQYIEGNWMQLGEDIDGEESGDQSGFSVSISDDGSIVAIGAIGNNAGIGHARIFQYNDEYWVQMGEDIDGEESGERFGMSVSINDEGSVVGIGADLNDENGIDAGNVRVFEYGILKISNKENSFTKIYPNPTSGILNLNFCGNNIHQIKVSDITGKAIIERIEMQQNSTVDLSSFENGIYIISIKTDKEIFTTKIVKR